MTNAAVKLTPPSAAHWFGTDALGRDILSRVIVAARLDLGMAISAVVLSFVVGLALGAAAGYFGGWTAFFAFGQCVTAIFVLCLSTAPFCAWNSVGIASFDVQRLPFAASAENLPSGR